MRPKLLVLGMALGCLAACGAVPDAPIQAGPDFLLHHYLDGEKPAVMKSDLKRQMKARWVENFEVFDQERKAAGSVNSCLGLFEALSRKAEPISTPDRNAFGARALTCKAAELLLGAGIAAQDMLPPSAFSAAELSKLPHVVLETTISAAASKSILDDAKDLKVSVQKASATLISRSDKLRLFELARADVNHDGFNDALILKSHNLTGGTIQINTLYVASRLTQGGEWVVLAVHPAY